ncbi:MAG: hypothetical protein Q8R15_04870, partial [Candidatus Micrarchaeota archaeon]|nr:hypothetical protein [Candidatus Micrarchaeota archaeon]
MFDFLKKKISNFVEKLTGKAEEKPAEKVEEKIVEGKVEEKVVEIPSSVQEPKIETTQVTEVAKAASIISKSEPKPEPKV